MKFFVKSAVTISGNKKVDVTAPNKGEKVKSKTTPVKPMKDKDGPKTNVQQPMPKNASLDEDWKNLKYMINT